MSCYGCLAEVVFALARPYLNRRYYEGREQRYGHYPADVPDGALWVHAVSVGEVQSAFPFVKFARTCRPDLPALVSTTTTTGNIMARQLLGTLAAQIYRPWDSPSVLKRTLKTLRPKVYVTIETEIWPEMLNQLELHHIPAFMVNGRLSQTSYEKYARFRSFSSKVIRRYTRIMTRSEIERERFIALGADAEKVFVTGDCKVDALIERKNTCDVSVIKRFLPDGVPVILAGSTHEGEDSIVLEAFSALRERFTDLRLVIVPRHPERACAIQAEAKTLVHNAVFLSSCTNSDWHVLVVDRIGVLFPLYGCVKAAFLGGSIALKGGQNIMEPAIWGIPFCQGPDYRDFTEATEGLRGAGLCTIVRDAEEMRAFFEAVLSENCNERYAEGSRAFFARLGGASRRSWEYIQQALDERTSR